MGILSFVHISLIFFKYKINFLILLNSLSIYCNINLTNTIKSSSLIYGLLNDGSTEYHFTCILLCFLPTNLKMIYSGLRSSLFSTGSSESFTYWTSHSNLAL